MKSIASKREKLRILLLVLSVLAAVALLAMGTIFKRAAEQRAESMIHGATLVSLEESVDRYENR